MRAFFVGFLSYFGFIFMLSAQQAQFPIVKEFGGIYDISSATVRPDSKVQYQIVIDIVSGPSATDQINPALNNVARMLNLHGIAGVLAENLDVVLAIHGDATVAVLQDKAYSDRFHATNPNLHLIAALRAANVKLTVCGQSLVGHGIDVKEVDEQVEIATSMLTTMTTYQMLGYAYLRF
ncbi:MAG: DsrE family protein [Saprospiraceae bacterium]|nr:DsrE family protein [Saprospiraceae bacterium]